MGVSIFTGLSEGGGENEKNGIRNRNQRQKSGINELKNAICRLLACHYAQKSVHFLGRMGRSQLRLHTPRSMRAPEL